MKDGPNCHSLFLEKIPCKEHENNATPNARLKTGKGDQPSTWRGEEKEQHLVELFAMGAEDTFMTELTALRVKMIIATTAHTLLNPTLKFRR